VRRAPFRLALLALVALAIGAVLLLVGTGAGNRRLHREIDGQLERLLHGPVSIESVSVSIDGGLQVHGNSIDVYPRGEGHSLTTRHAIAEIHVPSLVLGRFKLSRLLADGIHLEIERSTDGAWAPTPFALLAARPDQAIPLYEAVAQGLRDRGLPVETGEFGAHMDVRFLNEGPVTILVDTRGE